MTSIKLGVHLPVAGREVSPERITQVAREVERLGLDSVWTWERLLRPTEPIAMGGAGGPVMEPPEQFGRVFDPLETLAYVAATTSTVALGTSVLNTLFHGPVVLARRLATLDRLSGGRLLAGIGQGWMEHEFVAAGVSMQRRGAGFEEHVRAMQAVWGPDPVRFEGRFYRIPEAEIGPKPVRAGGPTLLVGAASPAAIERAARLGAGLTLVIFDWDSIEAMIGAFRAAATAAGRDPAALPIVLQVNVSLADRPVAERGPLLGSPEQVTEDLERAARLGVEHVLWNTLTDDPLEQLPLLAQLRSVSASAPSHRS
jgi:probable F420-dependent oxidoreductase